MLQINIFVYNERIIFKSWNIVLYFCALKLFPLFNGSILVLQQNELLNNKQPTHLVHNFAVKCLHEPESH